MVAGRLPKQPLYASLLKITLWSAWRARGEFATKGLTKLENGIQLVQ